jgi:hypothetical protein
MCGSGDALDALAPAAATRAATSTRLRAVMPGGMEPATAALIDSPAPPHFAVSLPLLLRIHNVNPCLDDLEDALYLTSSDVSRKSPRSGSGGAPFGFLFTHPIETPAFSRTAPWRTVANHVELRTVAGLAGGRRRWHGGWWGGAVTTRGGTRG